MKHGKHSLGKTEQENYLNETINANGKAGGMSYITKVRDENRHPKRRQKKSEDRKCGKVVI